MDHVKTRSVMCADAPYREKLFKTAADVHFVISGVAFGNCEQNDNSLLLTVKLEEHVETMITVTHASILHVVLSFHKTLYMMNAASA